MADSNVRVLSIQSHVVSGYVGNKSACFPLQVLGFEVDTINSVQFSNHTGYGSVKGQILHSSELEELMVGLEENELHYYSHLLTGYIGSNSFLRSIKKVVCKLKTVNPDLLYVCDPVMGDDGEMYVPEELLPIYREEIIPLADIITPNQFEAELLSGRKIKSIDDALGVLNWFHEKGTKTAVISSTELGKPDELICIASSVRVKEKIQLQIKMTRLPTHFTGTGDLFAALLMAWMHLSNSDIKVSIESTVATMQKVLQRTLSSSGQEKENIKENSPKKKKKKKPVEMKLIQSLDDIRNPCIEISALPF